MTTAVTETIVPIADPSALLAMFEKHIRDDHGIEFDQAEDGSKFIAVDGFRVDFQARKQGLYVRLEAQHESMLIFFKEEIAEHVGKVDEVAAQNTRWSGESTEAGMLPPNFKVLKVIASTEVFTGMQRLTLSHEDAGSLAATGLHLRLMIPRDPSRTPVWPRMAANGAPIWPEGDDELHARFITFREVRADKREIDIDIVRHNGGLISDWAQKTAPGQTVGVMGPAGPVRLPSTENIFFAGDGTGLPAIARYLEMAGNDASGDVVVALPEDCPPEAYLPETPLRIHVLHPDRFEDEVVAAAERLTTPKLTTFAFFAGEFQNAQDLRGVFKGKLGLDKSTQLSTAYWRRGVPGFGQ